MGALNCRPALRKEYERLVAGLIEVENTTGTTPVHVLPGEREAIKLELKSDRLIQSSIELTPAMIARLAQRESLVRFGRAMLTGTLTEKRTSDGTRSWVVSVRLDGDEEDEAVSLGRSLVEVCDVFLDPQTQKERGARDALVAAADEQLRGMGDASYGKLLSTAARKVILPEDPVNPTGALELDSTLRLLLRERGDFMQGKELVGLRAG
jgi:hypothetical protein